jgi:hypothetical protein
MNEEQEPRDRHGFKVPTAEDEDAGRKRAREFDIAIYAPLTCRAQSDQARP